MSGRIEKRTIGDCTLYLGDCSDLLEEVGEQDALVTDPPYGIDFAGQPTKWQRRQGKQAEAWDERPVDSGLLNDLMALTERQVIWGANYYPMPPSRGWLAWYKPDSPPSMADFELAWTNLNRNAEIITHSISATNAERCGHPTQKPLAVMKRSISYLSHDGTVESVFDAFMGSGTTGVACAQMGKRFVGIEREPKYFEMACKRIEDAYRQGDLFIGRTA